MTGLRLGMPLLGPNNLSEVALLREVGQWRWDQIEALGGTQSSRIVDEHGNRLYAPFYYLGIHLPPEAPLSTFKENDHLRFSSVLRRFGKTQLDGTFHLEGVADAWVRVCNVFIVQERGPSQLKVTEPANLDFSRIELLPEAPDTRATCRLARERGHFWVPDDSWTALPVKSLDVAYQIDPDRDLNGAKLLYFANYVAILERAERALLLANDVPERVVSGRATYERAIGYFGNALASDSLTIAISGFTRVKGEGETARREFQFDYRLCRVSDGITIAVSSCRKTAPV
jgi:probable biosynthetic protein (TIGR04098 family)